MSADHVIVAHTIADDDGLEPAPIPAAWILEGAPVARVKGLATSPDGLSSTALWDCTAGRFEWQFTEDETVHILEGTVSVTCPSGATTTLRAGDVAYFPAGIKSEWHVHKYVKKLAVLRGKRTLVTRARAVVKRVVRPAVSR